MDLTRTIKTRRSVRKFTNKKPNWRHIIECIDVMRYAPMAGNNFSLKIILVDDKEKIQEIADACEQDFVGQAQSVVVVCTTPSRTTLSYEEKGEGYLRQQAGAAIQNFLLKIHDKKLATCWIGYFNEPKIRSLLRIPEKIKIEALFPVGYEAGKTKPKTKIDLDNILYFNQYNQTKMNPPKKLEV